MNKMSFLDCVDVVGSSVKEYTGIRKYVSTGALDCDHIDADAVEEYSFSEKPSRANLEVDEGCLLFAKMQGTKKTLMIDKENQHSIYSTGFAAVRPKDGIITARCLYHLVTSDDFLKQKDLNCSGATQKAITNEGMKKIIVSIPDIEDQERIVKILDKVDELIRMLYRNSSIFDEIVKSRFVEMFGMLDCPAQDFPWDTLKNLCIKITDGKHGGCTQEEGTDRFFVGAREIYDDAVHYDTAPQINIEEFEKDYKRCNVERGDFLIVNTGATIGKSAITVDERTEHTLLQKSVALLKTKRSLLHPVFLKYCYIVNDKMYKVESASAQPNLLLSKINATEIYMPPMVLQEEFVAFVAQTDKSKHFDDLEVAA